MQGQFKQLSTRHRNSSRSISSSRRKLKPVSQDHYFIASGIRKRRVFFNVEYTAEEHQTIKQVRIALLREKGIEINQKEVLLRYWYSNNLKLPETLHNLEAYHQWFTDPEVQNLTLQGKALLRQGFNYSYDYSLDGRPFAVMQMGMVDIKKYNLNSYMQALNYVNNRMIDEKLVPGKIQTYDYVLDANQKLIGLPLTAMREIILRISEAYSMMLGKMYVVNVTTFAKFLTNGLDKFLSQETTQKIKFYSADQVRKGALRQFIADDVLQQKYGGSRPNVNCQELYSYETPRTFREQLNISHQTQYFSIDQENPMFVDHKSQMCCGTGECSIY